MRPPVRIRDAKVEDIDVVVPIWLTTYKKWAGPVPARLYYPSQRERIYRILQNNQTFMACDLEDENHIYGWICGSLVDDQAIVHYLHVKEAFRRHGIARELIKEFEPCKEMYYTHFTKPGYVLAKIIGAMFNPYLTEGSHENRTAESQNHQPSVFQRVKLLNV